MAQVDTLLSQLIINQLTKTQYNEALNQGKINTDELYFVTDDQSQAISIIYNNTQSQLKATNVQTAIDELTTSLNQKISFSAGQGTDGQFALSDGKGGIKFETLINRKDVGA